MALKYALFKNNLTEQPTLRAVPQNVESYQLKDLLDEMTVPGGVTTTQAAAVLDAFMCAQRKILKRGGAINTEYYNIHPCISGTFTDDQDAFDGARHEIYFSAQLGTWFNDVAVNIDTQKVAAVERVPHPALCRDSESGTVNGTLTPGKPGKVTGDLLKFDEADPLQGVFFVNGAAETRAAKYLDNTNGTIIFTVPDTLAAGSWALEVRAIIQGTKSIRTGRLKDFLSVA